MQLMHWLLAKLARTDFSRALWYAAATAEPPPSVLPERPTPAWQSTFTPVMPAECCVVCAHERSACPETVLDCLCTAYSLAAHRA